MLSNLWERFNAKLDDTFDKDFIDQWCRGFVIGAFVTAAVRGIVRTAKKSHKN